MGEIVNFSRADLKHYWLRDFALGRDFELSSWHGHQLVETERANGVLIHMDSQGAPKLKAAFVDYLDQSTYGVRIPYERIVAIYDAMHRENPDTLTDERMAYLHKTLTWWGFWRRDGVTETAFAERVGVHERTVRKWLVQALRHVEDQLKSPVVQLVHPASYIGFDARA